MAPDTRPDVAAPAEAARREVSVLRHILRRHGRALLIAFACIALPLWGFGELAEEVMDDGPLPFDEPVLRYMHAIAGDRLDRAALVLADVGYAWGVVPADVLLVIALALRRRWRDGAFAALALAGSGLLNVAAKHVIARPRPNLWTTLASESTYSFPSGHAMGSATLAAVCIVLAWNTRWRWVVLIAGSAFAVMVGLSRVYLGVHYPSDILAGWCAALAWVLICRLLVRRERRV
ncbi:phosphatase PAP2 family protein [Lysobacter humi (ex Lee et al. 2017)]